MPTKNQKRYGTAMPSIPNLKVRLFCFFDIVAPGGENAISRFGERKILPLKLDILTMRNFWDVWR